MVVQSFPIVWVTSRPFQMYASLVVLSKVYASPIVLSKCMGQQSSFPIVWATMRLAKLGNHGKPQVAMGGHGFGNFLVGLYHWDRLGMLWEATEGHARPWVR